MNIYIQVLKDWSRGFNDTKNDYVTTLLKSNCQRSFPVNVSSTYNGNETFLEEEMYFAHIFLLLHTFYFFTLFVTYILHLILVSSTLISYCVQAALAFRELFICGFAYSNDQNFQKSKMDLSSMYSSFEVQYDETDLPRITRETCTYFVIALFPDLLHTSINFVFIVKF